MNCSDAKFEIDGIISLSGSRSVALDRGKALAEFISGIILVVISILLDIVQVHTSIALFGRCQG